MWISSTPPSAVGWTNLATSSSPISCAVAKLGLSVSPIQARSVGALAEREVPDAAAADHVVDDLLALAAQQRAELFALAQHVRVERAGETAVGGEDDDGGAVDRLGLGRQHVVDVGVGRDGRDGRVTARAYGADDLHPRQRLLDSRCRDELHGTGDLLGRLGRAGSSAGRPEAGLPCRVSSYSFCRDRQRLALDDLLLVDVFDLGRLERLLAGSVRATGPRRSGTRA